MVLESMLYKTFIDGVHPWISLVLESMLYFLGASRLAIITTIFPHCEFLSTNFRLGRPPIVLQSNDKLDTLLIAMKEPLKLKVQWKLIDSDKKSFLPWSSELQKIPLELNCICRQLRCHVTSEIERCVEYILEWNKLQNFAVQLREST